MQYVGFFAWILLLVLGWGMVVFGMWRKFRLDIDEKLIFGFGLFTGVFAIWMGFSLRLWIGILGILILLGYFATKFNWDGFEILDYLVVATMFYLILDNWIIGLFGIVGLICQKYYRNFKWYKSGKPGLPGLLTLGMFGIYFVLYGFKTDLVDQIAGIWLLTGSVVAIYLRSKLKLVK